MQPDHVSSCSAIHRITDEGTLSSECSLTIVLRPETVLCGGKKISLREVLKHMLLLMTLSKARYTMDVTVVLNVVRRVSLEN